MKWLLVNMKWFFVLIGAAGWIGYFFNLGKPGTEQVNRIISHMSLGIFAILHYLEMILEEIKKSNNKPQNKST